MKGNKKKETKPPPALVKETEYVPKSIIPNQVGLSFVIAAKPNSK
jgi:hypothetical protein